MTALETIHRIVEERHTQAKAWKQRTGGKVVGFLCNAFPEEVAYAAGVLPVRIFGGHEPTDITEAHIWGMFCPYSRDTLAQGLLGRYDYVDGMVATYGCYQNAETFNAWQRHVPISFSHYIFTPTRSLWPSAKKGFIGELQAFQRALQEWTGSPVAEADLWRAVRTYDENRRLMKQVYELRKADEVPISGSEALEVVMSSMIMDKAEHNQLLKRLLSELPQREDKRQTRVRLMDVGSICDDPGLDRLIESLGADVVIDDQCIGSRYFWNLTPEEEDPLSAIAQRYLDRPPCPVFDADGDRRRLPYILDLAREYRVQSAILVQAKFCDPHQFDMPTIERVLKENGFPSLKLEVDITIPAGQYRTRIEAHLEMLELAA